MPTPAPSSGIRDNHTRGTVGDFLRQQLKPGADLDLVTAYFFALAVADLPGVIQLPERSRLSTLRKKLEGLYDIKHPLSTVLEKLQTLAQLIAICRRSRGARPRRATGLDCQCPSP
jgi:hypothetical protein